MTTATARMFDVNIGNAVATLTLSRPPVNAISEALIVQFHAALDDLAARTDWTVLHVRSDQKVFCAGADLNEIRERILAAGGPDRMFAYAAGHSTPVCAHRAFASGDDCRDRWSGDGRRSRAGARLRSADRRGRSQARPARGPARADPRRRRDAASHPARAADRWPNVSFSAPSSSTVRPRAISESCNGPSRGRSLAGTQSIWLDGSPSFPLRRLPRASRASRRPASRAAAAIRWNWRRRAVLLTNAETRRRVEAFFDRASR